MQKQDDEFEGKKGRASFSITPPRATDDWLHKKEMREYWSFPVLCYGMLIEEVTAKGKLF
jgi:hypothetical protein